MSNKNEDIKLVGAAKMMENVFTSGLYQKKKYYENRQKQIKDKFNDLLKDSEIKKHEFNGVVAKYQSVPVYKTDHQGLLSFLEDFGLLPAVAKIDDRLFKEIPAARDILKPWALPTESYVRFYPNKKGKEHLDKTEYQLDDSIPLLSQMFLDGQKEEDKIERALENEKDKMLSCPHLKQAGSLKSNFGTVKRVNYKQQYDIHGIYEAMGPNVLLNYGKVDMKLLEEFIYRGFLKAKDIDQFRTMVDYQLRFIVTDVDSEERAWDFFRSEHNRKAQKLRYA